jgi:hypothetical protein
MKIVLSILLLATALAHTSLALGNDYITVAPPTVYEATEKSPQNEDFDTVNNMFIAHPGWYNDYPIHYYKFRIYAPGTYSGLFVSFSNMTLSSAVPITHILSSLSCRMLILQQKTFPCNMSTL